MRLAPAVGHIHHVCLRVRDAQRSVGFYCGVLGFEEHNGGVGEKPGRTCRLCDARTGTSFGLMLIQDLPPGDYLTGLDHLAFDAASPDTVDRLYRRAVDASCRAAPPRLESGHWKTYIFDPDGYKIEISASAPDGNGSPS